MFTCLTPETLAQFRAFYFAMASRYSHSVLLDSCGWEGITGGFYLAGFEAEEVIQLRDDILWYNGEPEKTIANRHELWHALDEHFAQGKSTCSAEDRFTQGWIGTVGYELNHLLEPSVPQRHPQNPLGLLYFVQFRHRIVWYPQAGRFQMLSADPVWRQEAMRVLQETVACDRLPTEPLALSISAPRASLSQVQFEAGVLAIQEHIRAGNIYQANLSIRFEHDNLAPAHLPTLYRQLVTKNPSPFSGVFQTPCGVVLSNSPERLVRYESATNILQTRPIAGTRGRGKTPEEEAAIDRVLQTDPKEQAEHLMLVDLERNDIGRVAAPGTVHVPESFVLERYSHVTHIVSQVQGQKAPDKTPWHVLQAMFPGGTITGCPKVRCMQILAETEPVPRGLYTGSLGYIDYCGNLDFNILIRSLFYWPDHRLHYHAGAGIVIDSVPVWEYRECFRKAEVIQGVLCHDPIICHPA